MLVRTARCQGQPSSAHIETCSPPSSAAPEHASRYLGCGQCEVNGHSKRCGIRRLNHQCALHHIVSTAMLAEQRRHPSGDVVRRVGITPTAFILLGGVEKGDSTAVPVAKARRSRVAGVAVRAAEGGVPEGRELKEATWQGQGDVGKVRATWAR